MDLRKAFDVIDHGILLDKLTSMGVSSTSLPWLDSYLNNTTLSYQSMSYGVPRGSCLVLLFFLIYVNDLINALDTTNAYLYVDDTVLYQPAQTISDLEVKPQSMASKLEEWCKLNRQVINSSKSKIMHFHQDTRSTANFYHPCGRDTRTGPRV